MPKVLLVDDEPGIRLTMGEFLKREGYETLMASDYDGAVAILNTTDIDVAVVDIIMPRKSGIEVLKEIRQHEPYIPVIMITGEPNLSQVPEIVRAGAYDFMSKPVIKEVLIKAVSRAVEKKRLIDEKRALEEEIKRYAEELEGRVAERTAELRQREEALRDSEERHRLLFESNPLPILVYDFETLAFLAVNGAAVSHYGYSLEEFLTMTAKDLCPPEELPVFLETISRSAAEPFAMCKRRHQVKGGTIINVETTARPIIFAGRPAVLVLVNDITDRVRGEEALRRMQAQLAHSEKIAALGRVAAQVAHEVKNPLAGLLLYAMHLRNKVSDKLPGSEVTLIDKIIDTINHLSNTVEQILNFARPLNLTSSRTEINPIVNAVLQLLQPQIAANNIELQTDLCESNPSGMLDEASIRAMLTNLVLNAIQAMPDGGVLSVATAGDEEVIRLTVTDTGGGLTEEQLENVFEPFYTTKSQGLGLGMPYAKKVLEQHQGTITLESRPGQGTRVRVELPAEKELSRDATTIAQQNSRDRRRSERDQRTGVDLL